MIMILLDIIFPRRPIRHPVLPDTLKPDTKPVLPETSDTVISTNDTIVQTKETIHAVVGNFGSTSGNDDTSTMIWWSVLIVLFALCLCFYFVLAYRRTLTK